MFLDIGPLRAKLGSVQPHLVFSFGSLSLGYENIGTGLIGGSVKIQQKSVLQKENCCLTYTRQISSLYSENLQTVTSALFLHPAWHVIKKLTRPPVRLGQNMAQRKGATYSHSGEITVSANLKRVHIEPKHIHIGHDLSHIAPKMG